ncbi:MAG: hypothetical protein O7D86_06840 [Proteobacteria bacterium]|nr:hypothetical protein [Pseudomonadota bacterium]
MKISHQYLDIYEIELDPNNPRVAHDLENYMEAPDTETLEWVLNPGDAKFNELRQAITTHGGIINPIIVNFTSEKYHVIEGNTRLVIYRMLNKEDEEDLRWKTISSFVHEDMSKDAIAAIRLQAHLVGIRNWKLFAKAKYLHYLWNEKKLSPEELVDFCGGNSTKVRRLINAYKEMMEFYKPLVNDDEFETDKFSIFLESQAQNIRKTLQEHKYKPKDLAKWVAEGKFEPRQELIRRFPDIMNNSRSREVFLNQGAAKAELYVERPEVAEEISQASFLELCKAIDTVIEKMKIEELKVVQEHVTQVEDTIKSVVAFYDEQLCQHSEMQLDIEIT